MTNGIWHAMHSADKGDAKCTVIPFMGNSNSSFASDAEDFLQLICTKCISNSARAPCGNASARERERERRGDEKERRMTPTLETDLGGKSHSPPLAGSN